MRILITGATGFVGTHLIDWLCEHGQHEIHGIARQGRWAANYHPPANVVLHTLDLGNLNDLRQVLGAVQPEWIFHLAGYANTGRSFREPDQAWSGNWQGTFQLYQALASCNIRARVLYTSTGLVYGSPTQGSHWCRESDPLFPASPYAASKAAADLLSYQVTCHPGLDVVRVRCFNQIGPRQAPDYATASFARQVAMIEQGLKPPILETGDLSAQRDLTDVRDMVRSFTALLEQAPAGEVYNAGSGQAQPMSAVVEKLVALTPSVIQIKQLIDPQRQKDTSVSRSDIQKIRQATGWSPAYSLEESLHELLNFWRDQFSIAKMTVPA